MKSSQTSFVPEWNPCQVFEATLVVIAVCLGFWLLYLGRIALFGLFAAIVISTAIAPAVDWMRRRGLPAFNPGPGSPAGRRPASHARPAVGRVVLSPPCVYTVLVFALLEFGVEPRLYNRRQFSSLLVVLLVIALWNAAGVLGLLAAPPLAAGLQILAANLLAPGAATVAQPIEERFAALEGRLASFDASLGIAPEAPSPQLASLVTRLGTLVAHARRALANQGALLPLEATIEARSGGVQPAAAPSPSAAPAGGLSEAPPR